MSKAKPAFSKADEGRYFQEQGTGEIWQCVAVATEPLVSFRQPGTSPDILPLTRPWSQAQDFTRLLPEKKRKKTEPKAVVEKPPRKTRSDKGTKRTQTILEARESHAPPGYAEHIAERLTHAAQQAPVSQKQEGEGDGKVQ